MGLAGPFDSLSKMSSHSLSKISPRRTRSSTAAEGRPSRSAARNVPQAATISQKKRFTTAHHQQSPLRKSAAPAGQAKTVNKEPLEANGICTKPIKPDPKPVEIAEGMVANVNGNVAKRPALEEKVVAEEPASTANSNSGRSAKRQKMNETKLQKVKSFKKGTFKSSKFVGAHISTSGGLENAVHRAVKLGARSFGLFLRPQRQWSCKPLTQEAADRFRQACRETGFAPHQVLPHGSYLLNCGSPDQEVLQKSRAALVDELRRCEMLGLVYYNFHPGSSCGVISKDECIERIAESINLAHRETTYVIAVIENMCKQGHTIGGDFSDLRGIIDRVKDKSRIGVCLDTCHAFAAGYDLSTAEGFEKMMTEFESVIGLPYLKGVHLNDSKGTVGSHLDRHENIGRGLIGLEGFQRIMQDPRLDHVPMILETPETDYASEISLLNQMCSS